MRVRIPGSLLVFSVAASVVVVCLELGPGDETLEDVSAPQHVLVGHPRDCLCCSRYDLAKRPMTRQEAEWVERVTHDRLEALKATSLRVRPANR
jgi:hypothetical protein